MSGPQHITSRDNPLVLRLRRLAAETTAYRRQGQVWLEGEHLCTALRSRGLAAAHAVVTEEAWQQPALRELAGWAAQITTLPAALFKSISGLESPAGIAYLFDLPQAAAPLLGVDTVVLDRVQDAGNVGSILRSAAALGVAQVLAIKGTAALWSPKVLRAGMGAHFALQLIEGLEEAALVDLAVPLVATSSHGGDMLHQAALPAPCAWVLGHEGQGIASSLLQRCALQVRIPQPGGEESLNVAAAAAICLYESATRRSRSQ